MISEIIADIIQERVNAGKEFAPKKKKIEEWTSLVNTIFAYQKKHGWNSLITQYKQLHIWVDIISKANELDTSLTNLASNNSSFYKAFSRASRKWLNLGAIGTWRQGKSEFISKLTGLDEWLIPRHDSNDACTGTTVNIINGKLDEKFSDIARVFYYDIEGFVELLNRYFKALSLEDKYQCHASDRKELLSYLIEYRDDIRQESVSNTRLLEKCCEYFEHTEDYINSIIDKTDQTNTDKNYKVEEDGNCYEDIKNINTQKSKEILYPLICYYETPDTPEDNRIYSVLAVKSVDIYTSYDLLGENVGKIQIYDTPGLGEAKIGVDETLKYALRYDLDIAIALRKARVNDPFNDDDSKLDNILKSELENRKAKNDWLYFLLNYYLGTPASSVRQLRTSIVNNLGINLKSESDGIENSQTIESIQLASSHFGIVDCKRNKRIDVESDEIKEYNDGVKLFVKDVLTQVVTSIKKIDSDFYEEARIEFNGIQAKYDALVSAILKLNIPAVFSIDDIVPLELLNINKELMSFGNVNITQEVSNSIASYAAEETVGAQLLKLFNHGSYEDYLDTVKQIIIQVSQKLQNEFNDSNSDKEALEYKKDILIVKEILKNCPTIIIGNQTYKQFKEFSVYSDKKVDFAQEFKNSISEQISDKDAKKIVDETKNKIWQVFRKKGRLEFICPTGTDEEWFKALLDYLTSKSYFDLRNKFKMFYDFKVDIQKDIENFKNSISKCFHKDDFGTLNFETEENACLSFMYSLYIIEKRTKDYILSSDGIVQGLIDICNNNFGNSISDFSQIASPQISESTGNPAINPCYIQLRKVFADNFDKIYEDDPRKKMQSTINDWMNEVVSKLK